MATPSLPESASVPPEVRIFFRDIKEHPDDDTPRLIFADWLQEHGDAAAAARGEFLRLQVLRHRLAPDDPSYGLLKRREGELFREHCWTWLGPLRDAAKAWTFERGMIQITAQMEKLLSPEVDAWTRTGDAWWIDALALTEIASWPLAEAEARGNHLSYSPLLTHINRFDLSGNESLIGPRLLFRALRACNLPFLTQLLLSHNRLATTHIRSLSRCRHFLRLALLDLQHNRLDDAAAALLAESPYLKNLRALRLGHNRFTTDGVAVLRQAFGDRVSF